MSMLLLGAIASLLVAPRPAAADDPSGKAAGSESSGEPVSVLAEQLTAALEEGRRIAKNEPQQPTVLQQRRLDAARGAFERAHRSAQRFSEAVKREAPREEVDRLFRTVGIQLRNGIETASDAQPSPAMRAAIDRINETMRKLEKRLPDPE